MYDCQSKLSRPTFQIEPIIVAKEEVEDKTKSTSGQLGYTSR